MSKEEVQSPVSGDKERIGGIYLGYSSPSSIIKPDVVTEIRKILFSEGRVNTI